MGNILCLHNTEEKPSSWLTHCSELVMIQKSQVGLNQNLWFWLVLCT